jgi:hypothetical protein
MLYLLHQQLAFPALTGPGTGIYIKLHYLNVFSHVLAGRPVSRRKNKAYGKYTGKNG